MVAAAALVFAGLGSPAHAAATDTDTETGTDTATATATSSATATATASGGVCVPTVEEVEVCGRMEQITEGCEEPFVTPAMRDEAANHDELKDEFQRLNACVSTDPGCAAKPDRLGDQTLNDEVAEYNKLPDDMPTKIKFHFNVTDFALVRARDDMALVVHKGFRRDPLSQHMLYRVHEDKKFNEDAEGVALVQKRMADRERAELIKQAAALDEMSEKFRQAKDVASEQNTTQYKNVAVGRALALEAISCELDRISRIDRRTEDNMKALADVKAPKGIDTGSPGGSGPPPGSDITGIGKDDTLPSGTAPDHLFPQQLNPAGNGAAAAASAAAASSAPVHSISGSSSPPGWEDPGANARARAEAALGAPSEADSLFLRVHRQYQVREAVGRFQPSLLD